MNRSLWIGIVGCILAISLHAETIRVMRFTGDWTPDPDTDIKLYHSLNDDIVAPENSQRMYEWLVSKGVQHAVLDTSSLTGTHLSSATYFLLNVITYDLSDW